MSQHAKGQVGCLDAFTTYHHAHIGGVFARMVYFILGCDGMGPEVSGKSFAAITVHDVVIW